MQRVFYTERWLISLGSLVPVPKRTHTTFQEEQVGQQGIPGLILDINTDLSEMLWSSWACPTSQKNHPFQGRHWRALATGRLFSLFWNKNAPTTIIYLEIQSLFWEFPILTHKFVNTNSFVWSRNAWQVVYVKSIYKQKPPWMLD